MLGSLKQGRRRAGVIYLEEQVDVYQQGERRVWRCLVRSDSGGADGQSGQLRARDQHQGAPRGKQN